MKCLYHKRRTSENRYLYDKDVYKFIGRCLHRYVIIYSDSFMVYKINIHIVHFWQNNETANDRIFCYITLHNHISLNYMNT